MSFRTVLKSIALAAVMATAAAFSASAQYTVGDREIDGSLCVGNDCVNGESFGFDTVRLKENNLRIHFDDTSTTASFPPNDWRIRINDSSNGGDSYFAVEDATAGRTPFRVEAGARNNALFVDSQGDVGIGTSTPATDIDIKIGDTPTVRLQQDGTSGFTPQTWEVAGNEAGFFIRDATSGSTLPFRIITGGAPSQSLVIDGDGDVGVGAGTNPEEALHVERSDGSAQIYVEETGASGNSTMFRLSSNARPIFEIDNNSVASDEGLWRFSVANNGDFEINNVGIAGTPAVEFDLANDGDLTIAGTLTENSDKNAKMAIVPVDSDEILAKVTALEVSHWTYKHDADEGIRHIGPMAQDFYALFGTGAGETGISTLDTSGVALAAIQALSERVEQLTAQTEAQQRIIDELRARD